MTLSEPTSEARLDFVARQLAGLMKAHSAEAALAKVAEECGPEYASEVATFKTLLTASGQENRALGGGSFQTLEALMPAVPGGGAILFREYNEFLQRSRIVLDTYWAGIAGLLAYLGTISVIALLLGSIYVLYVLPPLAGVYEGHGATLPALTRAFFHFGNLGIPVMAIVLVAALGSVAWFAVRFRRRIRTLAPLPRWPAWLPLFGPFASTWNLGLFLNCAKMLRKCGVSESGAVAAAAGVSNQADELSLDRMLRSAGEPGLENELNELGLAARLGNFDAELDHQCERHVGSLTRALMAGRDRLALILKLLVYAAVAVIVIAIYLPIFQIAAIV